MIRAVYLFASIFILGCTIPTLAVACTAPPGAEGDITYNTTYKMMQFCDGTNWIAMAGPSNDGGGGGVGPTASDGYFVYTDPVDPDFGGLAGANSYCLSELTSRDWKNKDIALANGQLIASKVRAFLCDGSTCQNAEPDTTYYFASSHDSSAGGASFTTNSSGLGPNDNELWRTADRFSGGVHNAQAYWSGRAQGANTSRWPNTSSTDHCSGWTTTSSGVDGRIGFVNDYYTSQARWSSWTAQCSGSLSLVCFVHP